MLVTGLAACTGWQVFGDETGWDGGFLFCGSCSKSTTCSLLLEAWIWGLERDKEGVHCPGQVGKGPFRGTWAPLEFFFVYSALRSHCLSLSPGRGSSILWVFAMIPRQKVRRFRMCRTVFGSYQTRQYYYISCLDTLTGRL